MVQEVGAVTGHAGHMASPAATDRMPAPKEGSLAMLLCKEAGPVYRCLANQPLPSQGVRTLRLCEATKDGSKHVVALPAHGVKAQRIVPCAPARQEVLRVLLVLRRLLLRGSRAMRSSCILLPQHQPRGCQHEAHAPRVPLNPPIPSPDTSVPLRVLASCNSSSQVLGAVRLRAENTSRRSACMVHGVEQGLGNSNRDVHREPLQGPWCMRRSWRESKRQRAWK